jgi:hypothetical protein
MLRSLYIGVVTILLHVAIGRLHDAIVCRSCSNCCEHVAFVFSACREWRNFKKDDTQFECLTHLDTEFDCLSKTNTGSVNSFKTWNFYLFASPTPRERPKCPHLHPQIPLVFFLISPMGHCWSSPLPSSHSFLQTLRQTPVLLRHSSWSSERAAPTFVARRTDSTLANDGELPAGGRACSPGGLASSLAGSFVEERCRAPRGRPHLLPWRPCERSPLQAAVKGSRQCGLEGG